MSYLLACTGRILMQRTKDRNKLCLLHAPEVKSISKGMARTPYELSVKVSIATTFYDPKFTLCPKISLMISDINRSVKSHCFLA